MDQDSGCQAVDDGAQPCDDSVPDGAPVDLCRNHLIKAYLFMRAELAEVEAKTALPGMRPVSECDDRKNVVYYIRFGDRIKIGTTKDLRRRLAALPHDELLAVEPGGYDIEASRHRQFQPHRISGDWFKAHADLASHAACVREQHFGMLAEAHR
ncbi:GIY-YIG nuclease family protein [Streptomyces sp. NPDC090741]|uniref:GIY-YIG nuclease family protein n=1 Tax=Streptomyces sp. NPDC090741 TaxID=3365967 RepID=UPI00382A9B62